jgi:hypothetical protein
MIGRRSHFRFVVFLKGKGASAWQNRCDKVAILLGEESSMRRTICCLLLLLGSWANSSGQNTRSATPQIVKKFHLLDQTASISPVTIFTPQVSGVFRVSTVIVMTLGNSSNGFWYGILGFTNEGGEGQSYSSVSGVSTSSPGAIASGVLAIVCKAGTPLTFSTVSTGEAQHTKYDVFIIVERIG